MDPRVELMLEHYGGMVKVAKTRCFLHDVYETFKKDSEAEDFKVNGQYYLHDNAYVEDIHVEHETPQSTGISTKVLRYTAHGINKAIKTTSGLVQA
jgi:hypothetical protein